MTRSPAQNTPADNGDRAVVVSSVDTNALTAEARGARERVGGNGRMVGGGGVRERERRNLGFYPAFKSSPDDSTLSWRVAVIGKSL